ncbi:RagB/SusD family nutrient uptake outer membrane protein [Flavobacterium sp. MK4S-17]|uniref:RagB/SusD family nutrient uptake outer membrane protein n=1 Tax=Flavobacterium sp. MK4S-17 TaxID=2543737 RepID=UPI00135BCC39|nr:RagB/SusD family nutrient uptake outer membrane protein [Flavobacterium sp. MK4S-17]
MKKIKLSLLYLMGIAFVFNSCTSELDVTPEDDDIFRADDFYKQPGAYKQALAGVYGNLALTGTGGPGTSFLQGVDAGTSQYGRCLLYLQDLTTDEMVWSYENDPGTRELQRNIWSSENPILLGMFSRTMVQVALANEYLRQSTPSKLSSRNISSDEAAEIEVYRNEVRVLRAMAYYNMIDLFGKAPFITENDPVNFAGPEYNRAQLFEFVEDELNAVLPGLKPATTNEYGRVDQGVANMLLAKLYLNAEVYIGENMYTQCAEKCQEIISSGYTLNPNYLDNFKADNHTSPEMIFTLQSDGTYTQNYGPTTVMVNGQVGSLEVNGESFGVSAAAWSGAIRLRKQFSEKFSGSDFVNDDRNTIIIGERPIDITSIGNKDQGYILGKYSNISTTGVVGQNSTFVNTDFPLFRLADVYLMYAECALRGAGGTSMDTALGYVNDLRERANSGSAAANIVMGELTLDFLIDERARELHWEAHRRQDLIRFNKYTGGSYNWAWKGNAVNGISLPNYMKVFPIPVASRAANPNLTQNTGY